MDVAIENSNSLIGTQIADEKIQKLNGEWRCLTYMLF